MLVWLFMAIQITFILIQCTLKKTKKNNYTLTKHKNPLQFFNLFIRTCPNTEDLEHILIRSYTMITLFGSYWRKAMTFKLQREKK